MMKDFLPCDVTEEARSVASTSPSNRTAEGGELESFTSERKPIERSLDPSRGKRAEKVDAKGLDYLLFGREQIDLRGLEQLVDVSQVRAVGAALLYARRILQNESSTIEELLDKIMQLLRHEGLEALSGERDWEAHPGNLAFPRRFEIAGALNRLRSLKIH